MSGSKGNVTKLDTLCFDETIAAYAKNVKEFERIVNDVNKTINNVTNVSKWKGQGRNAFEKDSKQVQLNLKDISGKMYDVREALIKSHVEYLKTDMAVAKRFDS